MVMVAVAAAVVVVVVVVVVVRPHCLVEAATVKLYSVPGYEQVVNKWDNIEWLEVCAPYVV